MSEQTEEDGLLFKTSDSDHDLPSTSYLRTNFDIHNTPTETPSKTIEIQALNCRLCSSPHYDPLVERMQYLICSRPRLRQRLGQGQQAHINLVQGMGL